MPCCLFVVLLHSGNYCAAGSESHRAAACGAGSTCGATPTKCYCPSGTPSRKIVSDNHFTLPEDPTKAAYRTGQDACPLAYRCTDGIKELNLLFTDCGARTINEGTTGNVGGPLKAQAMDGSTIAFSIGGPVRGSGCSWSTAPGISIHSSSGQVSVTSNSISYESCSYFTATVTAAIGGKGTTCNLRVNIGDVNERPSLLNCGATRKVVERSAVNTPVGVEVRASDPDLGESLFFR